MINQIGALSAITVAILLTSTAAAEEIRHDLAADVSASRIEADIVRLVGFGTRHTLSET